MDSLEALKRAIANDGAVEFGETIKLGSESFPSSTETAFEAQDPEPWKADLGTIVFAWLNRDKTSTDYIQECEERGVRNLKFAERADLLAWLRDEAVSEYILSGQAKRPAADLLEPIYAKETKLVDHNSLLHGSKQTDFSGAAILCHKLIMQEYRKNQSFSASGANGDKQKPKEPIILLSPSPSSLINMANIKEFLETGTFVPITRSANTAPYTRLNRDSPALGKLRFFVVDDVTKFKPEYWDRVVAVFVTGQPWQLKPYKWSDPNQLFSHVYGVSVNYKADPVPATLKGWNVSIEEIERSQRFRDHEVVERIWDRLEGHMLARGWGKR